MNGIKFQTPDSPAARDTDFLYRQLLGCDGAQTGPASIRKLAVIARGDTEIVAGLFAFTHWNWLKIRHLRVAGALRHQGLDRHLVLFIFGIAGTGMSIDSKRKHATNDANSGTSPTRPLGE
jgi:hypothetical protein